MDITGMNIGQLRETVKREAPRVGKLGGWSQRAVDQLVDRIPNGEPAAGFDAGIACALGLIPRDLQIVSAELHANWSPDVVQQIRDEINKGLSPHSQTTWWLAACGVCDEDNLVDEEGFMRQIGQMKGIDPVATALEELQRMRISYKILDIAGIYCPFGVRDGSIQAAYISGHDWAVCHHKKYDIYFVGTFRPSLGLEEFEWEDPDDPETGYRGNSGLIYPGLAKCADRSELLRAMKVVQKTLGPTRAEIFEDDISRDGRRWINRQ